MNLSILYSSLRSFQPGRPNPFYFTLRFYKSFFQAPQCINKPSSLFSQLLLRPGKLILWLLPDILRNLISPSSFGQEQGNGAIAAIGALSDLGQSGQAATLAGGSIQFLLAAANPCGKLTQADNIIKELGTSDRAVAAARGLVAAEQNFNPFVVSIPSICSDPTLPVSSQLRGVVPLIDPAVGGQDVENANSKKSVTTPFDATGLSVAQVMVAQGFSNFTAVAQDGTKVAASSLGGAASGSSASTGNTGSASSAAAPAAAASTSKAAACKAPAAAATTLKTVVASVSCPSNFRTPIQFTDRP